MTLRDTHRTDVLNVILTTGDFAESVLYTPLTGEPLAVKAMVKRSPVDNQQETTRAGFRTAIVTIANDQLAGFVTPQKGDTITLSLRPGYPAEAARVEHIEDHDAYHRLGVSR